MKKVEYSTACKDWAQRLIRGESIIPPPIFKESAKIGLEVFKNLRIGDLPGKPTFGEISKEWVFAFVAAVFGGYDPNTAEQLIKEYGLLISKKNTKSTLAAGIMLTAMLTCWRENEEHLIIAPSKEVADNSFQAAASMVRADPTLSAMLKVQNHVRAITHLRTGNSLKVSASTVNAVSGKKAGRVLVDELWVFGKHDWAEAMLMEATGGQISRPEGFTIYLTTQSETSPCGVFKNKLEYWRNVRDGVIEDKTVLPVIYEFPQDMIDNGDFKKPENFYISNPNIGASVSKDWLERQLMRVEDKRDGTYQQFIAKHFNVEISSNLVNNKWAASEFWDASGDKAMSLGEILNRCEVVCCGIDGGGLDDLLGFAVIGREKGTGRWLLWNHAWAHHIALERNSAMRQRLLEFVADGDLTIVNRPGEDVRGMCDYINHIIEKLPSKAAIGVDAAGISAIVDALTDNGIEAQQINTVPQGWKLNSSIKTVERMVAGKELIHGATPLMQWCVQNARISQNGNAVMISKMISNGKIDPLMATFNAVWMMSLNPSKPRKENELILMALG